MRCLGIHRKAHHLPTRPEAFPEHSLQEWAEVIPERKSGETSPVRSVMEGGRLWIPAGGRRPEH